MREAGLEDREVVDLATATAFFAWANRLMLSLGEAACPAAVSVTTNGNHAVYAFHNGTDGTFTPSSPASRPWPVVACPASSKASRSSWAPGA